MSHSLFLQTTFPTRFTRANGTLIDNFFCKLSQSMLQSAAGILINKIVKINVLNDDVSKGKNEIKSYDAYNKLNKNPNADKFKL